MAKFIKGSTRVVHVPAAAASYTQGDLVAWDGSGTVAKALAATGALLGVCLETATKTAGEDLLVEIPADRTAVLEIEADGAVNAGATYGINDNGTLDSDSAANQVLRALQSSSAAGTVEVKILDSVLQ